MKNKNKPLLMEVNRIFKTIDYDYSHGFDVDNFYRSAIKTLNRCETLKDANVILSCVLQFQRLYDEFYNLIQDKECLDFFMSLSLLPLKFNELLQPDDSRYFVSNGLTPDHRKFYVTNTKFDGEHIGFVSSFNSITTYNYKLQVYNKIVKIFTKDDELLLKIKLNGHFLSFVYNKTNYVLIKGSKCVNVYQKDLQNAKEKLHISNSEYCVASFSSMRIKHPNQLGIVSYNIVNEEADKELLNLIAISYLILIRK